jgi:hypothetical protein
MSELVPHACGLNLPGLDDGGYLMRAPAGEWPLVHASHVRDHPGAPRLSADEANADRLERASWLGRVIFDRHARTARYFTSRALAADEFVRPYLDNCFTAFSRWEGREVFHAGGFVTAAGAWAVVGESRAGKSTLLAALLQAGCGVLADDLLVVDDERAYAGPRCVDLRAGAVDLLGLADRVRPARRGTAQRLPLPPMEPAAPFRGWVFLKWSAERGAVRLPPSDCLARVTGLRMWADAPTDPRRLLRFASLPAFELRRPPGEPDLGPVVEELLRATGEGVPFARAPEPDRLGS